MNRFSINADQEKDIIVLRLHGDFDVYTLKSFEKIVMMMIDKGCRKFVLDLNDLRIIDSSGLGCLIKIHSLLKEKSGQLRVFVRDVPTLQPRQIFKVTRTDQVIPVHDSRGEAIKYMELGAEVSENSWEAVKEEKLEWETSFDDPSEESDDEEEEVDDSDDDEDDDDDDDDDY
jgi:anti-sigma B factor antagonist